MYIINVLVMYIINVLVMYIINVHHRCVSSRGHTRMMDDGMMDDGMMDDALQCMMDALH